MSGHTWWYLARASGFVAWALVSASVISGLLIGTRLTNGRAKWLLDVHRFLAGSGIAFIALHVAGLVADSYVHFGVADLLLPFASSWRPGAVALGVVAVYLLAAIEISSLLMRRLSRRVWRAIHLASFVVFWTTTYHLLLSGTDARNPVARWSVNLVIASVVFLTVVRILSPRGPKTATSASRTRISGRSATILVPERA